VVLGMGVKCKADVVCSQEPQRERGDVGISHLADEIRQSKRVWTAIGKGTGLVVDERTDVSRGANDDIIVTDLRSKGEKITRIVNIYDQRDTVRRETGTKIDLAVTHSAERNCPGRGFKCRQQSVGPKVPSAVERRLLGRGD
jgi:hypothetical protein